MMLTPSLGFPVSSPGQGFAFARNDVLKNLFARSFMLTGKV